ncbi:MAG: ribosome recycling factor [Candidatus Moranbacteria bacterium]|nr:ribosome recycling factor [Candidatus Moranbacteria bacterium]
MGPTQILQSVDSEMKKSIAKFREEIRKIHTGRANPSLVEGIMVEYYGSKAPLKQVASINIPEPRAIAITPWNRDDLTNIEKAICDSDLKLVPQNNGESILISLPPLTEERRKEMAKLIGREKENVRIQVKQHREEAWDKIQELGQTGSLPEDEKFRSKNKLQEIINKYNTEIDQIADAKEKEIMTV